MKFGDLQTLMGSFYSLSISTQGMNFEPMIDSSELVLEFSLLSRSLAVALALLSLVSYYLAWNSLPDEQLFLQYFDAVGWVF